MLIGTWFRTDQRAKSLNYGKPAKSKLDADSQGCESVEARKATMPDTMPQREEDILALMAPKSAHDYTGITQRDMGQ